nr:uncharacterized protein LOC129273631 [Lytechinus pictus]XP_054766672.1 uncharacterized protein LOC129273631 [Lytechinus pictus]
MPPLTLFLNEDVTKLLHNKYVVILGDSIQRGIYKDLVALLQGNEYLSSQDLKAKGEKKFMNDVLMEGGIMHNGINYREVRQYRTDFHLVRFYFITRIFNKYWENIIFPDLQGEPVPDVVIMNSCLWDVSRYGQKYCMTSFKRNIETTFSKLNSILPIETLIIWNTALPVARDIKGGFLLPELKDLSKTMRLDVLKANYYAKELAKCYEIDVLDLNYFFHNQMHRQVGDGVHWNYVAHRRISNLILAHIAVSWGVGCPRGKDSLKLPENLYFDFETEDEKASRKALEQGDRKTDSPAFTETKENVSHSSASKDKPTSTVRLEEKSGEKLARPSDSDNMKDFNKDDGRSVLVSKVKDDKDGRRSRSPIEMNGPRSSRSPLEQERPPSRPPSRPSSRSSNRSEDRADSGKRHQGDRSPTRTNTPPLGGTRPAPLVELEPIDIGNIPKDSLPLPRSRPRSPGHSFKSSLPRAGGRYQPYPNQNSVHPNFYPQNQPQSWLPSRPIAPRPYYPQPQYMPYPNPQAFIHQYPQDARHFLNPYQMPNLQYDNRMRQRLAAERNLEVMHGFLQGDVYGLL